MNGQALSEKYLHLFTLAGFYWQQALFEVVNDIPKSLHL